MTLINRSSEPGIVSVAIFKRPIMQAALGTIAWKVVSLLPNVPAIVQIDRRHRFEIHPRAEIGIAQEAIVPHVEFDEAGLDCDVEGLSQLRIAVRTIQVESVNYGNVQVGNRTQDELWVSVLNDSAAIYPPFVIRPGQVRRENLRQPFYLAVIPPGVSPGDRLDNIDLLATQMRVVDGAVAVIRGNDQRRSIELFRGTDMQVQ